MKGILVGIMEQLIQLPKNGRLTQILHLQFNMKDVAGIPSLVSYKLMKNIASTLNSDESFQYTNKLTEWE